MAQKTYLSSSNKSIYKPENWEIIYTFVLNRYFYCFKA